MANFILVHGAFDGAWCWTQTADDLRALGHTVLAPDLPGAGDDPTPAAEVTLHSATQCILELLHTLDGPAVLVGHSMGGIIMTQAAAQAASRVARLVYVTAFRPVDGESLLDLTHRPEAAGGQVEENLTVTGDPPVGMFDLTKAHEVFYHDVPHDQARDAIAMMGPQPLQLFDTPVTLGDAVLPPQVYVVCTHDRAIPPRLQRFMAQRSPAEVHEVASGHSPFYSMPEEMLRIMHSAAL